MVEPRALVEQFLGAASLSLEVAAALVILVAGATALVRFGARSFRPRTRAAHRPLRHDFGRSLLLGLDFTIGSDVLKVALAPTFEGVGVTGLAVLVRTVLTLVLEYELKRGASRGPEGEGGPEAAEDQAPGARPAASTSRRNAS